MKATLVVLFTILGHLTLHVCSIQFHGSSSNIGSNSKPISVSRHSIHVSMSPDDLKSVFQVESHEQGMSEYCNLVASDETKKDIPI